MKERGGHCTVYTYMIMYLIGYHLTKCFKDNFWLKLLIYQIMLSYCNVQIDTLSHTIAGAVESTRFLLQKSPSIIPFMMLYYKLREALSFDIGTFYSPYEYTILSTSFPSIPFRQKKFIEDLQFQYVTGYPLPSFHRFI